MKKLIQRQRTMRFFIEAASNIIKKEGVESITIRRVADEAGYNSATLYNYFRNLEHLTALAALSFIDDYTAALEDYISSSNNSYELNILVWECFYKYSYRSPQIFMSIFGNYNEDKSSPMIKEYYELYPEKLDTIPDKLNEMIVKENLYDRSMFLLMKCSDEGYFKPEDLSSIDEMLYFIYKGMMSKLATKQIQPSDEKFFINKSMNFTKKVLDSYRMR